MSDPVESPVQTRPLPNASRPTSVLSVPTHHGWRCSLVPAEPSGRGAARSSFLPPPSSTCRPRWLLSWVLCVCMRQSAPRPETARASHWRPQASLRAWVCPGEGQMWRWSTVTTSLTMAQTAAPGLGVDGWSGAARPTPGCQETRQWLIQGSEPQPALGASTF